MRAWLLMALAALATACSTPAPAAPPAKPAAAVSTATPAARAAPTAVPQAAAPRPPDLVRITDIQISSAAGSYIAATKGYFEAEGIRAEFVPVSTSDQIPALVSGQGDVAGAAINAFLFNAFGRGLPIKIVADHGANLAGASAGGFVVRKDLADSGAYRGAADVRGWKLATGTAGSAPDIALDRFLRGGGLTLADVETVQLPFPDHLPALANQAVQGSYWQEPFTTIAVERGIAVRGPLGYDVYPNQQIAGVLFAEKLLGNRDLAVRYLRAYTRGVRDYVRAMIARDQAMFDEVVPILIERTTVKDRALFEKSIPSGLKPDPLPNLQSIVDDQEWYIANGHLAQRVNVAELVDSSLVEEAIRQLGSAGP